MGGEKGRNYAFRSQRKWPLEIHMKTHHKIEAWFGRWFSVFREGWNFWVAGFRGVYRYTGSVLWVNSISHDATSNPVASTQKCPKGAEEKGRMAGWPWVPFLTRISRISSKQMDLNLCSMKMKDQSTDICWITVSPMEVENGSLCPRPSFLLVNLIHFPIPSWEGTGYNPRSAEMLQWNHPICGQASCDSLPWKQRGATWQISQVWFQPLKTKFWNLKEMISQFPISFWDVPIRWPEGAFPLILCALWTCLENLRVDLERQSRITIRCG